MYCGGWKEWKWAKFKLFAIASDQQILWREFACCEYLILASLNYLVCWQCYCVNLQWLSRVSVLLNCQFLRTFLQSSGFCAPLCAWGKLLNAIQWTFFHIHSTQVKTTIKKEITSEQCVVFSPPPFIPSLHLHKSVTPSPPTLSALSSDHCPGNVIL